MNAIVALSLITLGACASSAGAPKSSERVFSSITGQGPCAGDRYAVVDNRTKYETNVSAVTSSGTTLIATVAPGKREEVLLPGRATHVRTYSNDAANAGVAGGVAVQYACH